MQKNVLTVFVDLYLVLGLDLFLFCPGPNANPFPSIAAESVLSVSFIFVDHSGF